MPTSPLETAGAAVQPVSAAPLHTNEFFTGLWTNGNPLGPGPVPYLYQKFYSASRYDRMVGGKNVEISTRLTPVRRPGHSVYNAGPFPPINRFYEFRGFTETDELIHLLADCDAGTGSASATVREVTQPATNNILWTKLAGAGRTSFVSNGNSLFAGDGKATHQWVTSAKAWEATTQYNPGDFILDSNGNFQMAVGSVTATIVNILVQSYTLHTGAGTQVTLFFSSNTPFDVPSNIRITTSGLTTVPAANTTTPYSLVVESTLQASWTQLGGGIPVTPYSTETGTATTGTGITGATQPAWSAVYGQVTQDGGNQWVCMGSAVMPWGSTGPTVAPTVAQAPAPSIYPNWAASTWYSPHFVIVDSNGNLQQLTTAGTTGAAAPSWATVSGTTTNDGSCVWTCKGAPAWAASTAYNVGDLIIVTWTFYITTTQYDGHGGTIQVQHPVTTTALFTCTVAGTTGANQPSWNAGLGTTSLDGTVTWTNSGAATSIPWPGATQILSLATKVIDSNGYAQLPTMQGESGTSAPTWDKTTGVITSGDGTQAWMNAGAYAVAATQPWQWAYSGKNSITGMISNASPISAALTPGLMMLPVIQGQGIPNPIWDTIVLWRTAAGGNTLLYDDEFPNPGVGQTWIYTDTNVDPGNVATGAQGVLNPLITAPINNVNDPPPSNFIPQCYYLGRIWGYVNNKLRWTGGPDTITGNGNTTMPGVNTFSFPSSGVTCWPTSIGLICFTTSDVWAVLGQGTSSSPFYVVQFQQNVGLKSQDAFAVNGSTAYAVLNSRQLVSLDPGAGEVEVGFPIGDIFDAELDASLAYLTWHQGRSQDTALYVANGSSWWYRMSAVAAPESGNVWSPQAVMAAPGQVRAMASIEISPGEKVLVAGPNVDGHPILFRDLSLNSDAGTAYDADAMIAAVVLAQPGTTAGVQFVVTEERRFDVATLVTVKMLYDEIADISADITDADFRAMRNVSNDPPNLPPQKSVATQRMWAMQDPESVIKCRYYQQELSWPAEDFANELYTNTVYGRLPEKARK